MKSGSKTCRVGTCEVTHKGKRRGRPKMLTPEEFEAKADDYINHCAATGETPNFAGLAYHMGFAAQQSLHDYAKDPDYKRAYGRARLAVEKEIVSRLMDKERFTSGQMGYLEKVFGYGKKMALDRTELGEDYKLFEEGDTELVKAGKILQAAAKNEISLEAMQHLMNGTKAVSDINKVDELERLVRELADMAGIK